LPSISTILPFSKKRAGLREASITPRGLQENL
jgi:hypothetical protein